jgi:hypothetical protein
MSASADVPMIPGDMRKSQYSAAPFTSVIFGQVALARHRSSMPAVARPRATSV